MALKLSWKNPNTVPNSIVIYRGDEPLKPTALPKPLVELTGGELFWIDPNAVFERTYYYILGVKTDNDLVLTPNQKVTVGDNRGVGPSTLKFGNDALGYYGAVNQGDFVTNLDIVAAAAKQEGLPTTPVQVTWHKYAREGKVLYVPNRIFGIVKWIDLYHAGLVFGTDDVKHDDSTPMGGLTPTNQLRVIEFKGQTYKIRLMRKWGDGKDSDVGSWASEDNDFVPNTLPNEHSDLVYPLIDWTPLKQRLPNVLEVTWSQMVGHPESWTNIASSYYGHLIGQERQPDTGKVLARGRREWASGGSPGGHYRQHVTYQIAIGHDLPCGWLPVLELIPESTLKF